MAPAVKKSDAPEPKEPVRIAAVERAGLFLLEEAMSYFYSAALRTAAVLKVADHLVDGPKRVEELGRATETDPQKLYRILRLLCTRGIFREQERGEPGTFELTPPAEFLRSDIPYSLRKGVMMCTDPTIWKPAGNFVAHLKEEQGVFKHTFGCDFWTYWVKNPGADDFHAGMTSMSELENQFLVRSYDFPAGVTVVDIAGGFGGLLMRILQNNQSLRGILFDHKHVLERHRLGELGSDASHRWQLCPGDLFQQESYPRSDFYIMKYIIHDWGDEDSVKILSRCRKAMNPGGKVLVYDMVVPIGNQPHTSKYMDHLVMAIYPGGYERTEAEFANLFERCGLKLNKIYDTGCYFSILEAVAADE